MTDIRNDCRIRRCHRALAANQGLYNLFLVAGLFWDLGLGSSGFAIKVFVLGCVFGAATVSRRILYVQAAPALAALLAGW